MVRGNRRSRMAPQVAVERASAKGSSTPSDGFGGATRKQASLESWAIASATILVMIVEWSRPFHDRCGFGRLRRSEDSHACTGPGSATDASVVGCRNLPGGWPLSASGALPPALAVLLLRPQRFRVDVQSRHSGRVHVVAEPHFVQHHQRIAQIHHARPRRRIAEHALRFGDSNQWKTFPAYVFVGQLLRSTRRHQPSLLKKRMGLIVAWLPCRRPQFPAVGLGTDPAIASTAFRPAGRPARAPALHLWSGSNASRARPRALRPIVRQ